MVKKREQCEPQPEVIEIEQVIASGKGQRVLDVNIVVPPQKPRIEQILNVVTKNLEIVDVQLIEDKAIVKGEVDIKVLYVADSPDQPVHAVELQNVKFIRDIVVEGAEPDMSTSADVLLEFVDFDFEEGDPDDPLYRRRVRVTLVLKVWVKVLATTTMDVYALPFEEAEASEQVDMEPGVIIDEEAPVVIGKAKVLRNNVNVRTGPGTNFPVVTKVNAGTEVTVREKAFGWNRVILPTGQEGWIAGWLLGPVLKG